MKLVGLAAATVAMISPVAFSAPVNATDGVNIGVDSYIIPYVPFTGSTAQSIDFITYSGSLDLFSDAVESAPFRFDGGILLGGSPIRLALGNSASSSGIFEIWRAGDCNYGTTASPVFKVDNTSATAAATFKGANVSIAKNGTTGGNLTIEGTLTVSGSGGLTSGGSPVLTQASIASLPKLVVGSGSSAIGGNYAFGTNLAASAPLTSFAVGDQNTSYGSCSFVSGQLNTVAGDFSTIFGKNCSTLQGYSVAAGQEAQAKGFASIAIGSGATANGNFSFASGRYTTATAQGSTAMGMYPVIPTGSATTDVPLDTLYSLGNGTSSTARSNAVTTLKNGQTTLRNSFWDSAHPVDPVTNANASAGQALVVEGNTVLKGKVTIATPQGDISPGIYAP